MKKSKSLSNKLLNKAGNSMKAIIYCRVSTKDQAEFGYSLDSQKRICQEYATRLGYEIIASFIEEGESAKTIDRTELKKLLDFISKKHNEINAIIVYKLDRLARNMVDYTGLVATFGKLGIDIKSATENVDDSPAGKLTKNMIAAIAQFDNDVRSERTKTGMMQAILEGRWCWRAPKGYKQGRSSTGKPLLIPSEDAPFIIEAFNLAATGLHKQTDTAKILKKKGFKQVNEKRLTSLLRNPLYAGIIKVDWHPEPINAIHQSLISKEIFFKVQQLLDGKRPTITSNLRNHPDFPLRNFIRCAKCSLKLTGGWSTGRKGIKYAYYHCRTKGCSLGVTRSVLESKFYEYLKTFQPSEEAIDFFEAIVLDAYRNRESERIKEEYRIEKDLKSLQDRKIRLDELMIKGTIDEETYKEKIVAVKNEIQLKEIEFSEARIELHDVAAKLSYCKSFLTNVANLWANAGLDPKQRFQNLIFPDKIFYEGGIFRTTATSPIFRQLQQISPSKSQLVAPGGFTLNQILAEIDSIFKFKDLMPMPAGITKTVVIVNTPQKH